MKQEKKKMSLASQIFIALILGGILGLILYYYVPSGALKDDILINGVFYVVGNGFLRSAISPYRFSVAKCDIDYSFHIERKGAQ